MSRCALLFILLLVALTPTAANAVDHFDAQSYAATAISDDGKVIAGTAKDSHGQERAFLWTQTGGMVDLGTLSGDKGSRVIAISGNGNVVVGWSYSTKPVHDHLFFWSKINGMKDLGTLPEDTLPGISAVSSDGSVVVGFTKNKDGKPHAFRWTQADGLKDLGTLSGDTNSEATGISANGDVIVGTSSRVIQDRPLKTLKHAFRWTQASGMIDLGTLPDASDSYADNVSLDGSMVIGGSYKSNNDISIETMKHATVWNSSGSIIDIGVLPEDTFSNAKYVSSDGKVIAGVSYKNGSPMRSFRWTKEEGMSSIGILPGENNSLVMGLSSDGSTAAGYNLDAGNQLPFLWTQSRGTTYIGKSPGYKFAFINGISRDAKTVIGQCFEDVSQFNHAHACRWNQQDGMIDLGTFKSVP